ncbi:Disease resistance protein [Quillaja saponaria]|uniref:Disease resistance protein n=1 Tax=Quillaja saponaria TaxID=32244 RepID=A0AAD7L2J5_QUISA|nr:Disease resistance protein [Quillaja saponaria]
MEIVIAIAGKIAEYAVEPIGRRLGYVCCYRCNVKELGDEINKLQAARKTLQHRVEEERRKGLEIESFVQPWLDRVDEIKCEVEEFQQDTRHTNAVCAKWWCPTPNLWVRHQLSRSAKKMAKDVVELKEKEPPIERVAYRPSLQGLASTSAAASRGFTTFKSRMSIVEVIMEALMDPSVNMIGVYGLGGVGKTALVKEIAVKAKEANVFDVVVIAVVTQTPDLKRIQSEIADLLGLKFDEESVLGRASRLRERINKEKKILVILDDIWGRIDLEEVGIPFQEDYKRREKDLEQVELPFGGKHIRREKDLEQVELPFGGKHKKREKDLGEVELPLGGEHKRRENYSSCKILLTSRNKEVLSRDMGTQKDFQIQLLTEAETWSLFQAMVGDVDIVNDTVLHPIAIEVAKKCAGLPVSIVTVARALKNNNLPAWKDALNQLTRFENEGMIARVYSALELSYNQLESDEVRNFVLLCGILGEISFIDDLLKYSMGLGIIKYRDNVEGARNRMYTLISTLKASCLLLGDDSSEKVQMHTIVREVAISIANRKHNAFIVKFGDELKEWPPKDSLRRCTQIILDYCEIQELPDRLETPQLQFFILVNKNSSLSIPDSFFEGMGELKVLDLTDMHITSLPMSFRFLTSLRTLCLDYCVLENMALIGALKNLEILSLRNSVMKQLPSEIQQLTRLRMLDLTGSEVEMIPQFIISSLTKLEELYTGNTSIKWEAEGPNEQRNASFTELGNCPRLTALEIHIKEAPSMDFFKKLERFKILIGDVWEWTVMSNISKTLKLKLKTRIIHLEHGINMLLKRVEDLYLDEMNGGSNIIPDLNGEGFPNLKHVLVQNNVEIKYIIGGILHPYVSFPKLESMVLNNLGNLEAICNKQLMVNSFGNLRTMKVRNCNNMKNLFTFTSGFFQLLFELEVSECESLEEILVIGREETISHNEGCNRVEFPHLHSLILQDLPKLNGFGVQKCENEIMSSRTQSSQKRSTSAVLVPLFDEKVAFPKLVTLKLSKIRFNNLWHDQLSASYSTESLTTLIVEGCDSIKHLFTSSTATCLTNLRHLEISKCESMEEIIIIEETTIKDEITFPKLETMKISGMDNLKTTWPPHLASNSCSSLKIMEVNNARKLVTICPSYVLRNFEKLEMLTVNDCESVKEIFDLNATETHSEVATRLKELRLDGLPNLKHIWSKDPEGIFRFHDLQVVEVSRCKELEYLFPASIAIKGLLKLQRLELSYCGLKNVVAAGEKMEQIVNFAFPRLNFLSLVNLDLLDSFYPATYNLECPSLQSFQVVNCEKLEVLATKQLNFQEEIREHEFQTEKAQALFSADKMLPNLVVLSLGKKDIMQIWKGEFPLLRFDKLKIILIGSFRDVTDTFSYYFLQRTPNLELLFVFDCYFKEIFPSERHEDQERQTRSFPRLKSLRLWRLPKLEHICEEGSQLDPVLEILNSLVVRECPRLTILVSSSASFSNLTFLGIVQCKGLTFLFSSSTAKSLVNLTTLRIKLCFSLEEIVESKADEAKDEISFSKLRTLELVSLKNLKNYSPNKYCTFNFPSLEIVIVRQCHVMRTFSEGPLNTPKLKNVKVGKGQTKDDYRWKGNLNATMREVFQEMLQQKEYLRLSAFPELREVWGGHIDQPNTNFWNLRYLVVEKCDFLTNAVLPSHLLHLLINLVELEVKDCDQVETIFEIKLQEERSNRATCLKKMTLNNLPKLKTVWNKDLQGIFSFQNLKTVEAHSCPMLGYLFPPSIAKDLQQLEEIAIERCGLEVIVVEDVKREERPSFVAFEFPKLISLFLLNLPRLRGFYPGRHSIEWPMLRKVDVFHCNSLELFASEHESNRGTFPKSQFESIIDGQHPLLSIEKVVPNLEEMAVNGKDITKLCHEQSRPNLLHRIKILHLRSFFQEQSILYPCTFLKRIPNLNTLTIGWSDFKVLFPSEELDKDCTPTLQKLRSLTLESLDNFECIWDGDSTLPNILENLEYLQLRKCSSLIKLSPFSISLRNRISLEVSDCRGLMNLLTFPIAKSLDNLEKMRIINCKSMEEIVANEEDEKGIVDHEIVFEELVYLQLDSLPRLTSFCRGSNCALNFPALEQVIVTQCPVMTTFSSGVIRAPLLEAIFQTEEMDKPCWNADLNTTIDMIFKETVNKKKDKEKKGVREGVQKNETEDATTKEEEKEEEEEGAMTKAEEGMWTEEKGAEEDGKEEGKVDDTETKEEDKKWAEETQVDNKGGHKGNEGDQNKKPDSPSQSLDELKSNNRKGMVPSTSELLNLTKIRRQKLYLLYQSCLLLHHHQQEWA